MADINLEFLARQNERILRELSSLRDDLRVTTAMVQRMDHTLIDLLTEVHAIHGWMIGVNDRIRKLEEAE